MTSADVVGTAAHAPTRPAPGVVRVLSRAEAPNEVLLVRRRSRHLVILKRLRAELEHREDLVLRLEQERRILALLGGQAGLVALDSPPLPYPNSLTLRFLGGGSLRERINGGRTGLSRVDSAVGVTLDVLRTLSHLHRHQVIHRDINPANVVFDGNDRAWLIDLSVAAMGCPARGLPAGWEEGRVGTIPYTAPEAVMQPAAPAHPSVDLYGIGVMLWEMITGQRPFERRADEAPVAFARRVADSRLPHAALLAHRAGPNVTRVVSALLAPSPSERPQSADEVAATLRSTMPNEAQQSRAPGRPVRL